LHRALCVVLRNFKQPNVIARSEATKQSSFLTSRRKLDCFASLAMTGEYDSAISPRVFRARFVGNVLPSNQRAQGIPGARCARSLVGRKKQPHQRSHHGHTGFTRHSPRNGFNSLFRALPGDRAFLSPSLKRKLSQKLDTSVEVSGPHAFAVRRSRSRQLRACVHRIQPRVRDVRETPLCGVDGMSITQRFDVVKPNSEIPNLV
jgi:hypothetical protein